MPALSAHYQFGQLVSEKLENPIKQIIIDNKSMFDIGLQGPDIFFFYKPYKDNYVSSYGSEVHNKSAADFFEQAILHSFDDKELLAYLMGVACHYALDRECHPYINSVSKNEIEHKTVELDFEHYIIKYYNLNEKIYVYIPTEDINYDAIEVAYNRFSSKIIKKSIISTKKYARLLMHRRLVILLERLINKRGSFSSMALKKGFPYGFEALKLNSFFNKSVLKAVSLINEVYYAWLSRSNTLYDFLMNFQGETNEEE